jgi:hypothetical protein
LSKKQELSLNTNALLESFDIYKKQAAKLEASAVKAQDMVQEETKEPAVIAQREEPTAALQMENKVVECSILQPK